MVYAVLGRLRSGRLARHVQIHAELRHPPRTRGRVARSRQPTDGRVRSERHEPHRRVRSENRLARRPHTQRRLDLRRRERRTDRARQSEEDQAGAARRRDVRDRREHRASRRVWTVLGALELQHVPARADRVRAIDIPQSVIRGKRSAANGARQPIPVRTASADRKLAWPFDRRRRTGRLCRSEQRKPEGSPVLGRHPARAPRPHGRHDRVHRRHRARHQLLRHERLLDQHQSDRPGARSPDVPARLRMGRGRAPSVDPEPVLRDRPGRRTRHLADDSAWPAAAAVPRVRQRVDARVDGRFEAAVQRTVGRTRQAGRRRYMGRPVELHVQRLERQSVGREQHLLEPLQRTAEQLRPGGRVLVQRL